MTSPSLKLVERPEGLAIAVKASMLCGHYDIIWLICLDKYMWSLQQSSQNCLDEVTFDIMSCHEIQHTRGTQYEPPSETTCTRYRGKCNYPSHNNTLNIRSNQQNKLLCGEPKKGLSISGHLSLIVSVKIGTFYVEKCSKLSNQANIHAHDNHYLLA